MEVVNRAAAKFVMCDLEDYFDARESHVYGSHCQSVSDVVVVMEIFPIFAILVSKRRIINWMICTYSTYAVVNVECWQRMRWYFISNRKTFACKRPESWTFVWDTLVRNGMHVCLCVCVCAFTCTRDCQLENSINSLANGTTVWTLSVCIRLNDFTVHSIQTNIQYIIHMWIVCVSGYRVHSIIHVPHTACVRFVFALVTMMMRYFECVCLLPLSEWNESEFHQHATITTTTDGQRNYWLRRLTSISERNSLRSHTSRDFANSAPTVEVNVHTENHTPGAQSLSSWWSHSHSRNCHRLRSHRHISSSRNSSSSCWSANSNSNRLASSSNSSRRIYHQRRRVAFHRLKYPTIPGRYIRVEFNLLWCV